ncbi:MAG: carbohydrate binding domain-containing protein [Clostridia bacterium]|nr:carbohydrate binding domain-containing protein [Clostridia bacterium]
MISVKKLLTFAAVALFATIPLSVSAATVADWQFNEDSVKSGSISEGSMVIADRSENGNDLTMRTYNLNFRKTVSFSDESFDGKSGSIYLNGNLLQGGVDFVTVDSAPINKNNFANGYTIEIIYKMPADWTVADRWTSLLSRLGSTSAIDTEGENVTTVVHVSNCKEIQFIPANRYNQSTLSSNVWSVAMDKAENWYHIVIVNDGTSIRTFVNGCESFRDAVTSTMQGLYADPNDGRFRIGARILSSGSPYRFTRGYIQQIRISDTALGKSDWLVPNPEQFVGEYGDNSPFEETAEDRYNFVFVPDTQNTTKFCGPVLDTAVNWLIENRDYANIEAVVSLGDNVEDFWETPQWEQITKTYTSIAQSGIRTMAPTGNHDSGNGQNFWYHNTYFGPGSDFAKLNAGYMLEYSPSGTGGVADLSAGSYPYKLVYIDMYKLADGSETGWLKNMLSKYAACPVIVVMHDIQNCSDTKPNETKLSANGTTLWNIVKNYDNVFLMVGGHSHGYGVLELTNSFGNKVHSILADYQFSYNGGNALMKFAEFDEKGGKIRVSTFSPYAATLSDDERTFFDVNFMTGTGHYDEIDINFMERFGSFKTYKVVGENIMTNPSFEDANGNFSLEGWLSASTNNQFGSPYTTNHCYAVNATSVITDNGAVTSKATTIPDGNWAFGSRWNDGKDGLCSLKRYVKVEPGKTYTVSYKVKHKTGADGAFLVTSLVANEGDDENTATSTTAGYIGTEWTTVERTFTATEDTDYILFWFRWLGGDNNGGLGPYWYFDDFSVREAEAQVVSFTANLTAAKTASGVDVTFEHNDADSHYIVAGYDIDGHLVSITSTKESSATLTGTTITTVKLFSWDGIKNIKPLATAKTASVE